MHIFIIHALFTAYTGARTPEEVSGGSDDSLSPAAQKAYIETLAQTLSTTARPNTRPEDMVRKSEVRAHGAGGREGGREKPFLCLPNVLSEYMFVVK